MTSPSARGLVSGTLAFSSVDGPGNRFVAFLQGCTFDCLACHNPYTIQVCNDCGICVDRCDSGALSVEGGVVRWNEASCTGGDSCIEVCPHDSTPKARWRSVAELVEAVRGPAPFLSGVTVSGGEATQQAPFVHAFFSALKADDRLSRLTRFVDSNGAAPRRVWDELDPVLDGAMIDLKALDPEVHQRIAGAPNDSVLASLRLLSERGKLHEVRLLLLPGLNDTPDQLARTAAWLCELGPDLRVKVIGFREHGTRPAARRLPEPGPDRMAGYAEQLRAGGLSRLSVV